MLIKRFLNYLLISTFLLSNTVYPAFALDADSVKNAVNSYKNDSVTTKKPQKPKQPAQPPKKVKPSQEKKSSKTKTVKNNKPKDNHQNKPVKRPKQLKNSTKQNPKKNTVINAPPATILVARARGKRNKDPKESINLCKRALKYEPYNTDILELIGNIHLIDLNELPQAKWWYEKALKYNNKSQKEEKLKDKIKEIDNKMKAAEELENTSLLEAAKENNKNNKKKKQDKKKNDLTSKTDVPTPDELMKLKK